MSKQGLFNGRFNGFLSNSRNMLAKFPVDFIYRSMHTLCSCVLEANIRWDQDPHAETLQGKSVDN